MIKRSARRFLARFPWATRVYLCLKAVQWWLRRRRSALSWTREYLPMLGRPEGDTPPRRYADIERQLSEELGRPLGEVFFKLDRQPLACTSRAQIHRARLQDGSVVAVKLQHPWMPRVLQADVTATRFVLRLLSRLERNLDFGPAIGELSRLALLDVDFLQEARSSQLLDDNFAHRDDIVAPRVYHEFTTPRLIVMEFVDGISITDVEGLRAAGVDLRSLARLIVDAHCEQIFVHGFFHADPHPANRLVRPGPQLVMIDFGLTRRLDPAFRHAYARLVAALADGDPVAMLPAFEQLGVRTRGGGDRSSVLVLGHVFRELLRLGGYPDPGFVAEADARVARALREDPVTEIPPELILILRQIGLLGWLCAQLGHPLDLLAAFKPYTEAVLAEAA
jgi:ubiquinone biosynthesis protein